MANKAIDDLLKYGSFSFNDNFTGTYTPSGGSVSNLYNNWNYKGQKEYSVELPYINNAFTGKNGTAGGNYCAQINRNKENYILNRAMDISYSFYHTRSAGNTCSVFSEFSIGGSTSALTYIDNYTARNNTILSGTSIFAASGTTNDNNATVYIQNNGTNLVTVGNYANNTTWYVFLKFRGTTLYYAINNTGSTPSSYSSVTLTNNTVSSNSAIFLVASSSNTDAARPAIIDNFSVKMY